MTNFTDIRDFLRAHCARYPELALQDVFKALYQSAFGCEHLRRRRLHPRRSGAKR